MTLKLDFEIIDHGCDGEQYFPGCGVYLTRFTDVITGIGESAREAGADAYNMLDTIPAGVDCTALESALAELSDKIDAFSDEDRAAADAAGEELNPEWHHYVSIRWRIDEEN